MKNAVNERIGRHRHRMKAERMRMLAKLNELAKETGLKGDIARSILAHDAVTDIDDCTQVYGEHSASK